MVLLAFVFVGAIYLSHAFISLLDYYTLFHLRTLDFLWGCRTIVWYYLLALHLFSKDNYKQMIYKNVLEFDQVY